MLFHHLLNAFVALFRQENLFGFFIDAIITRPIFLFLLGKLRDQAIDLMVEIATIFRGTGDDERGSRFVNED